MSHILKKTLSIFIIIFIITSWSITNFALVMFASKMNCIDSITLIEIVVIEVIYSIMYLFNNNNNILIRVERWGFDIGIGEDR